MSNWQYVQEFNDSINKQSRSVRAVMEFCDKHLSEEECDMDHVLLRRAKNACEAMLEILGESYLDSGYQYDDSDTRNLRDQIDDGWWDRKTAREGTSLADEMRCEISRKVVAAQYDRVMHDLMQLSQFREEWSEYQELLWQDCDHDTTGKHMSKLRIIKETYQYYWGERDEDGKFWTWGESQDRVKAEEYFEDAKRRHPNIFLQLIQQVSINKVIDTQYPFSR